MLNIADEMLIIAPPCYISFVQNVPYKIIVITRLKLK